MAPDGSPGVRRRAVLRATGGAVGLSLVGTAQADGGDGHGGDPPTPFCDQSTRAPHVRPCTDATDAGCADDHPATRDVQRRVQWSLAAEYPDVGTLIERGYLPYFDVVRPGEEGGYSHWLNPEFIGDDGTLDPTRPESVLVDNKWWRPIGVMFIATDEGDRIEAPPAVYGGEGEDAARCAPWHYHTGLPGRFAWWFYRTVYEGDLDASVRVSVDDEGLSISAVGLQLPCLTACMLHVWTYPNPKGVYAHGPPPRGNRGGPPAERPGFDTWAEPGEDPLDWDVLPEDVVERARPLGIPDEVEGWLSDDGESGGGGGWLSGWFGG